MANPHRESHHRNGITHLESLQQTFATKSELNGRNGERRALPPITADSVEKLFSCDAGCPLIQSLH
jgi:hypothetical protein